MLSFDGASAAALRSLAQALRSGQLPSPISRLAVRRVAPAASDAVVDALTKLAAEGLAAHHAAELLEAHASLAEARMSSDAELVWTGPETTVARSRDTAVVLAELFSGATKSILISTFVIHRPDRVFRPLAERMAQAPDLHVRLFANVRRGLHDTRHESEILREFSSELKKSWPGELRPTLFYDPRSLSDHRENRATWHAKVVVIDEAIALVTSANFTEWAHERNVEAGVMVRNKLFAQQLCRQFDALVDSRAVLEVPGFR